MDNKVNLEEENTDLDMETPPPFLGEFIQRSKDMAQAYHRSIKRLGQLETEVCDLKMQMGNLTEKKNHAENRYSSIETENNSLRDSLSLLRLEEKKLEERTKECETLREDLNSQETRHARELKTLEGELERLRKHRQRIFQYMKSIRKERENDSQRNLKFHGERTNLVEEKAKLSSRLSEVQNQLLESKDNFKAALESKKVGLAILEEKQRQWNETKSQLEEQNSLLSSSLAQTERESVESRNNFNAALESKKAGTLVLRERQKQWADVKSELVEQRDLVLGRLQKMTNECQNLKELSHQQNLEKKGFLELQEKFEGISVQNKKLQAKIESFSVSQKQLSDHNEELQKEMAHLKLEIKAHRQKGLIKSQDGQSLFQFDQEQYDFMKSHQSGEENDSFKKKLHERLKNLSSGMEEIRGHDQSPSEK